MRNLKQEILDKLAESNKHIEADMTLHERNLAYDAMEGYALIILKHFINNKWEFSVKESDIEIVLKVVERDFNQKNYKCLSH